MVTFDNSKITFFRQGDFQLVKSSVLDIQGRFKATQWTIENEHVDFASMIRIIVGGQAAGKNVEVGNVDEDGEHVRCGGNLMVIDLNGHGTYSCGSVRFTYSSEGPLLDGGMANVSPHRILQMSLPGNVFLQVNRWQNFINAKITMTKKGVKEQDGVCGTFDGNAADDSGKQIHARFGVGLPPGEVLFRDTVPLIVPHATVSSKRCPQQILSDAYARCRSSGADRQPGWSVAECVGDVCDRHRGGTFSFMEEMMARQSQ